MSDVEVLPELKEIVGAILFAARQPVSAEQILLVFGQTAGQTGGFTRDYAAVTAADLAAAIEAFGRDLQQARVGLRVSEVAQGYRLESLPSCGAWLRTFLDRGRPQRLTPPALETLAIVAYRQPVMRSEIEAVRGVAVDQILRNLLDMQLIRITGRSDLPGRPWLFGTSQKFLEHFGLKSLDDLPGTDELRRRDEQKARATEQRQMELPQGGEPGGATGFRADMDADRPGEDDVVAQLSVADQEDPGDLPDARPAPAPGEDETDAIRPQDYEDDERVSPPPRRKVAAAPAAPTDDELDAVADAPAGEAEAAVDGSAEEPVDEEEEDEFDDEDDDDDDDEDEDDDGDGDVPGTSGKPQ